MTIRASKPAFNIREKLKELTHSVGLKGRELMRAATVQEARDLVSAGRRNLIINGDMRISQRGTSFTPVTGEYTLDRWMFGSGNSNFTASQGTSTLPDGRSVNTFDIVCDTSTTTWIDPYQGIEDIHIITGQTVTISAWVKTNHPKVNFRQYGQTNFGDTFISDGQWHHYSVTTTLGALTITKGTNINTAFFGVTNSQNTSWTAGQYIQFTHFQLEVGKNATDFEYRSYGEELALCQRYYIRYTDAVVNGSDGGFGVFANYLATHAFGVHHFPTTMRVGPTMSSSGTLEYYSAGIVDSTVTLALIGSSPTHCELRVTDFTHTQGNAGWLRIGGSTSYIEFGAEI